MVIDKTNVVCCLSCNKKIHCKNHAYKYFDPDIMDYRIKKFSPQFETKIEAPNKIIIECKNYQPETKKRWFAKIKKSM